MKQLAINTNKHIKDRQKRREGILKSVIASSRIEGIELSEKQQNELLKRVEERLKK